MLSTSAIFISSGSTLQHSQSFLVFAEPMQDVGMLECECFLLALELLDGLVEVLALN